MDATVSNLTIGHFGVVIVRTFSNPPTYTLLCVCQVRKLLSEFKRTHTALWELEHAHKFEPDQLSALNDALVVPSSMFV